MQTAQKSRASLRDRQVTYSEFTSNKEGGPLEMAAAGYIRFDILVPQREAAMDVLTGGSAYHATDGAAYEVFLGRWTRRLAEPLLDFARFPDRGRILDIGCGTGSLACAMARRWPTRDAVGVDIAPAYIAFAKSQAGLGNIHFETADVIRLPSRFGDLPELYTFECRACGVSHVEAAYIAAA